MNKNMKTTVNGHGFFRKSKAYGLVCGIALGVAMLGAGSVSADEVTTPATQPATEVVALTTTNSEVIEPEVEQPSNPEVVVPATTITLETPASDELNQAVKVAQESGVQVSEGSAIEVETKEVAIANDAKQVEKIGEATKKQEAAMKSYEEALAKNQKAYEEARKRDDVLADKDGVVVYGKVDEAAEGLDYYKNLNVVDNVGKTGTVAVDGSIGWTTQTGIIDVKGMTHVPSGSNGVDTPSEYTFTDYKKGSQFTVTHMGKTKDGRNINVKVTLTDDVAKISGTGVVTPTIVYYADKGAFGTTFYNGQQLSADYQFIDDDGKPLNILQAFAIGDMDWLQGSKISFNKAMILQMNPDGSFLKSEDGYLWDTTGKGVEGFSNAPKGTYLVVGYGDTISYTHHSGKALESYDAAEQKAWDKAYQADGAGTAFSLFGSTGTINILPQPVKPLPVKVTYQLATYKVPMVVTKDVKVDGHSVNMGTIKKGERFTYDLTGVFVSKDRLKKAINQYDFADDFDETHDKYSGVFKVMADVSIKLKDGTIIKAGEELTRYAEQHWNTRNGSTVISLSKDFLNSIADDSDFQATAILEMERVKSGTVYNDFINYYNEKEVVSNQVETQTPEDPMPTPKHPQPEPPTPTPTPKPQTSVQSTPLQGASVATLPETGESDHVSSLATALGLMTIGFVGFGLKKKKEEN